MPAWLSCEDMEEAPVTAATGALGPVVAKLAALLGSEYKLRWRTRRDVKFIKSKLKPVHTILWNIWEREELDEASKELKMEALDLADDVDDAMVDFILSMERSHNKKRLVQTKIKASPFKDFKKRASDVSGRCRSKWKDKKKPIISTSGGKPRAFVPKDASELVGMVGPRDELIEHLVGAEMGEPRQVQLPLKTATIYGPAGMGKTTLANLVYETIGSKFESRAFVSVPPGGNTREVLARIFKQVAANTSVPVASTEVSMEEHLIDNISNFLKDKRYLVIIDDIWNWKEWEVIVKSLPENNLGSRIVGTTSINEVAKKLCKDFHRPNALLHKLLPEWKNKKGWAYQIDNVDITTQMIDMKANLLEEGFDYKHPIVHMCDGTPLAVCCMLSAVAEERSKQAHQGIHPEGYDVQDKIQKQVMQNGIQNTPGFEPLVESFQLALDNVPHHMLKTCLLFSSIYPDGHSFVKKDLVSRWISEGFVYAEGEANGYFEELVNRGFFMQCVCGELRMHPMMRNFLGWKSRQDNFSTCSSEITPSYNNTCRVRRLCIYNSPCGSRDAAADPLSSLDWYHIRSLIVYEYMERVPFEKLERVRVLDLCWINSLLDHELKDICGLVRLRHLLGFERVHRIREVPPEIVRLQCLETFEASGGEFAPLAGFIGDLQQLKTLVLRGSEMKELPREIASLQQLETLDISGTPITQLPKETGSLQQLKTLDISGTPIKQLPKEIGSLQQLKTLDISGTLITQLPKDIGSLQQLKILDISGTLITQLPKEIVKLQHLEHLLMSGTQVAKLPREIVALKELKRLILGKSVTALPLEVCALVELPDCIVEALNKSNLMSELASEMLSFKPSDFSEDGGGGIVVGAKQMHIPRWIKEHFNELSLLDVRICKLDEEGLKILREMPHLWKLTLRFEVVPTEPVVIGSQGFANLKILTIDSRVPRVTFQEGAMPKLSNLTFEFQFYNGQPNKDSVGTNHLSGLWRIDFVCNQDWYPGGDSKCIRAMIDIVRKEVRDSTRSYGPILYVCGHEEAINLPVEMEEAMSSMAGETEDEIRHIFVWKELQEQRRRGAVAKVEKKEMISRVGETTELAIWPTIGSFITEAQDLSSSAVYVCDRKEDIESPTSPPPPPPPFEMGQQRGFEDDVLTYANNNDCSRGKVSLDSNFDWVKEALNLPMEMISRVGETEHAIYPTIGSLIEEQTEAHLALYVCDHKEYNELPTPPPPLEMGRQGGFESHVLTYADNDISKRKAPFESNFDWEKEGTMNHPLEALFGSMGIGQGLMGINSLPDQNPFDFPPIHPNPLGEWNNRTSSEMGRQPPFYSESDDELPNPDSLLRGEIKRKEHRRRRAAVAKVQKEKRRSTEGGMRLGGYNSS